MDKEDEFYEEWEVFSSGEIIGKKRGGAGRVFSDAEMQEILESIELKEDEDGLIERFMNRLL